MFSQSWESVPIKGTPNHNLKFIRNPTCEHTVWDELLCLGTIWDSGVLGGGGGCVWRGDSGKRWHSTGA